MLGVNQPSDNSPCLSEIHEILSFSFDSQVVLLSSSYSVFPIDENSKENIFRALPDVQIAKDFPRSNFPKPAWKTNYRCSNGHVLILCKNKSTSEVLFYRRGGGVD